MVIGPKDKTMKDTLRATNLNWITEFKSECLAKIRSTQTPVEVSVEKDCDDIIVRFKDMQKSIAKGQSIVLYDGDTVIGGGIISEIL